jgi:hypothetical protein
MQKCTESKGNLLVILSHAQCFIKLGLKSGTKEEGGIGCSYMFVSIARSLLHYYHFIMHFIYLFVSCILYSFAYTLLFTYYYYLHIHLHMHCYQLVNSCFRDVNQTKITDQSVRHIFNEVR